MFTSFCASARQNKNKRMKKNYGAAEKNCTVQKF